MPRKTWMILGSLVLIATTASAIDFGAHIGYYDNDVKKAFVGADLMLPLGVVAISPNIDYTKIGGAGLWWGNADVDFRFSQGRGPQFWVGAGPTYYYVTGASEKVNEWGWDVNGGVGFSGTFRPYITARYNKIKEYKAGGVAVGLRFGR
jgi:hypothetical protein